MASPQKDCRSWYQEGQGRRRAQADGDRISEGKGRGWKARRQAQAHAETGRGLCGRSMMTRWASRAHGLRSRAHGLRSLLQASQPGAARALAVKAHPDRKALLECKRVVIKVGTAVVSNPNGELVGPSECECAARCGWDGGPLFRGTCVRAALVSRHPRLAPCRVEWAACAQGRARRSAAERLQGSASLWGQLRGGLGPFSFNGARGAVC